MTVPQVKKEVICFICLTVFSGKSLIFKVVVCCMHQGWIS